MDAREQQVATFGIVAAAVVIAFLGYESIAHAAVIWTAFWSGASHFFSLVALGVGAAAAATVMFSCIVIPVTTVTIYTIFRKAEERPKALIVAIGLFLDPLFIDFFRDKIQEGGKGPILQMAVSACGVVTFLVGTALWNKESILSKAMSVVLFLIPTLSIIGYVAMDAQGGWREVIASVITLKAANGYHFKTGQRDWPSGTENVLPCRLLWWQVGFSAPASRTALEHVPVVQ